MFGLHNYQAVELWTQKCLSLIMKKDRFILKYIQNDWCLVSEHSRVVQDYWRVFTLDNWSLKCLVRSPHPCQMGHSHFRQCGISWGTIFPLSISDSYTIFSVWCHCSLFQYPFPKHINKIFFHYPHAINLRLFCRAVFAFQTNNTVSHASLTVLASIDFDRFDMVKFSLKFLYSKSDCILPLY